MNAAVKGKQLTARRDFGDLHFSRALLQSLSRCTFQPAK